MLDKITLYPEQEEDIVRMMAEPTKSVLLAHQQDQGKTALAITFALRMNFKRVLFVGIKDTFEQFRDRALAQSEGKQTIRNINSTKAGKEALADLEWGALGWYFIGSQLLVARDWATETYVVRGVTKKRRYRKDTWANLQLDAMIVDEVHMLANYDAAGRETLHSIYPEWKMAMSGTFYGNKFSNAWAPAYWLWPEIITPHYHFWTGKHVQMETVIKRNGELLLTERGRAVEVVKGEKGEPGSFVNSLPCYIRRVGKEPVPEPEIITVDITPEQRRMYDSLENNMLVWIRGNPFAVEFPSSLRSRLRIVTDATFEVDAEDKIFLPSDAESAKIDALLTKLQEFPADRVVLGTWSKKFAKLVVARMQAAGLDVVEWTGDTTTVQRKAIKERWLADDLQYIVTVAKSFSTGLDWAQHNCWRMGVLSETDDQTTNAQWVRRVFRTGPNKDRFEWFKIQGANTKDQGQYANLELQAAAQQMSLRVEQN